ncbi:MAG: hypothetical protein M3Y22_09005 [Pseudomonadota bacterium]|nr:hypothetical protein [Pseudomonadota bacterium]
MGERYPTYIAPALAEVLGMPPHELHPWWSALREVGVDVPHKYEGEVSSALYFLITFAVDHPDDWRKAAIDELKRLKAGGDFTPAITASTRALANALTAAILALRSYQFGNGAPDLAQATADAGEAALKAAGLPAAGPMA